MNQQLTSVLSRLRSESASPEYQAELQAVEKAERRRIELERFERTHIPRRYYDSTLDSVPRKAVDYANAFVSAAGGGERFSRNLLIVGEYGTGKTETACAILRNAMDATKPNGQHPVVRFATMGDIKREVTATYGGEGSEQAVLERYGSISLLCIDDVGNEVDSKPAREALFALVNARYNGARPTIFTSQYGTDALSKRFSKAGMEPQTIQAIFRRITEDCEVLRTVRHG